LKPDVVVIAFGFNDQLQWDNRSDLEHAESIAARSGSNLPRLRFFDLLRAVLSSRDDKEPEDARPRLTDDEFASQIRAMIRWCRENDTEPVALVWPMALQMVDGAESAKQETLGRVAGEESVRLVDPVYDMRTHGGSSLFRDAVHANAAGCRRVADVLVPVLRDALETHAAR
jgi:lysophospholipase L1-like esterase